MIFIEMIKNGENESKLNRLKNCFYLHRVQIPPPPLALRLSSRPRVRRLGSPRSTVKKRKKLSPGGDERVTNILTSVTKSNVYLPFFAQSVV